MKEFTIPNTYRSNLLSQIKQNRKAADKLKKDFSPSLIDLGEVQFFLARHFGFCYGVENAIEIAFKTIEANPDKRIFFLSEMIHNPQVNADLKASGIQFLQDTHGNQLIPFDKITAEDIVLIPAFGTTLTIEKILQEKGIPIEKYNTTCPFVEKVWNRSEQIAQKGYTIIVHGKPKHEETRATFSHAAQNAPTLIVNDMSEAILLGDYITGKAASDSFYSQFAKQYSEGFDVATDLAKIGVVNQTTQLASDTQAISNYLKQLMATHYGLNEATINERFADTRDTLCYATNDNQTAVTQLLNTPADFALVVGGYNSSNTSHLVELCEAVLPTYFIDAPDKIMDDQSILQCNWKTKAQSTIPHFIPQQRPLKILITSGASCPDAVVEAVIVRMAEIVGVADTLAVFTNALLG